MSFSLNNPSGSNDPDGAARWSFSQSRKISIRIISYNDTIAVDLGMIYPKSVPGMMISRAIVYTDYASRPP